MRGVFEIKTFPNMEKFIAELESYRMHPDLDHYKQELSNAVKLMLLIDANTPQDIIQFHAELVASKARALAYEVERIMDN